MNKVTKSTKKTFSNALLWTLLGTLCSYQTTISASADNPSTHTYNLIKHIKKLSSDEFGGRLPGSQGEQLTIHYIADEFKQLGLQPGHHGSFFQAVPLLGTQPTKQPKLSIKSKGKKIHFKYGVDFIVESKNTHQKINLKDKEVVFVGFGMQADEHHWDDFAGMDLTDKVVVYLWSDRALGQTESVFGGQARSRHGMRFVKAQRAAAHGAAAAFIIHTQEQAGYPWEVLGKTEPQWVYTIDKTASSSEQQTKLLTTGMLSAAAGAQLFATAGMDLAAAMDQASQPGFKPFSLSQQLTLKFKKHTRTLTSQNVIGLLPAAQHSNEYLIYSAHWDHMGHLTGNGDQIFNGAVDNATGVAMLLELARRFSTLPTRPKRNILFLATTAEEQGLLGAHYYANHPSYPLSETLAVINMDSAFPFGSLKGMNVTGYGHSELEIYLERAAHELGRVLIPGSQPQFGAYFRSDHYPFAAKGIPAIFAMGSPTEEQLKAQPELLQKFIDFGKNHYHKPSDEYNSDWWDMKGILEDVAVFFSMGSKIADDNKKPNWYWDSEFRPIRDRQLKEAASHHSRYATKHRTD